MILCIFSLRFYISPGKEGTIVFDTGPEEQIYKDKNGQLTVVSGWQRREAWAVWHENIDCSFLSLFSILYQNRKVWIPGVQIHTMNEKGEKKQVHLPVLVVSKQEVDVQSFSVLKVKATFSLPGKGLTPYHSGSHSCFQRWSLLWVSKSTSAWVSDVVM